MRVKASTAVALKGTKEIKHKENFVHVGEEEPKNTSMNTHYLLKLGAVLWSFGKAPPSQHALSHRFVIRDTL